MTDPGELLEVYDAAGRPTGAAKARAAVIPTATHWDALADAAEALYSGRASMARR